MSARVSNLVLVAIMLVVLASMIAWVLAVPASTLAGAMLRAVRLLLG